LQGFGVDPRSATVGEVEAHTGLAGSLVGRWGEEAEHRLEPIAFELGGPLGEGVMGCLSPYEGERVETPAALERDQI